MTFVSTGTFVVAGAGPNVWVKIGQVGGWAGSLSVARGRLLARSLFGSGEYLNWIPGKKKGAGNDRSSTVAAAVGR
jgi:hypothetical protein